MLRSLAHLANHLRPHPSSFTYLARHLRPPISPLGPRLGASSFSGRVLNVEQQLYEHEQRSQRIYQKRQRRRMAEMNKKKKQRGFVSDGPLVRISKTMSYILRHGAKDQGLQMRPDGFVRVADLLALPIMESTDFDIVEKLVNRDSKHRYTLKFEQDESVHGAPEVWWIRANQGHSLKMVVDLELKAILRVDDIPTKTAVHGTTREAWKKIRTQGLSKMKRNHIHLAQGVPGATVISGMRTTSEIFIYVDVQKALDARIKFFMSSNGVVLTDGDERGYLKAQFFEKVLTSDGEPVSDWRTSLEAIVSVEDPITDPIPPLDTHKTEPLSASTSASVAVYLDPVHEMEKRTEALGTGFA